MKAENKITCATNMKYKNNGMRIYMHHVINFTHFHINLLF